MNPALTAGGMLELSLAAAVGVVVGGCVVAAVARLVDPHAGRPIGRDEARVVVVALALVAAALWWWEVVARGQVPVAAGGAAIPRAMLGWRWAGHVALVGILAAATWIDLRERVIPDAITVPGVIAGLAWSCLRPCALLPVGRVEARSFAAPLLDADVLGLCGPLGDASLPAWLGDAPAFSGLAASLAVFSGWWLGCTAASEPMASGRRRFDPRFPLLAAGVVGIGAAWWHGGDAWVSLLSSLAGLATGGAVVWMTRVGASWALGREALGFGDVTLMAAIGAWLGWQAALMTCCIGVLVGLAHGLVRYGLARGTELPFGPSLCAGALVVVVLWRPLWERVGPVFDRPLEVAVVAALVVGLTGLTLAAWSRIRGVSA